MSFRGVSFPLGFSGATTVRAAVGGLLVALALLGVSQAYAQAEDPPTTRYVVARQAIAPGTTLERAVLDLVPAELADATAGRAFRDRGVLDGAITLAPLAAGELVQLGQVLPATATAIDGVELSFAVAADRALGGDVRPGEWIDLVATFTAGSPRVVAERAVVTAVTSEGDGLLDTAGPVVLRIRLRDRDELLEVVRAVDEGQVTVARPGSEELTG